MRPSALSVSCTFSVIQSFLFGNGYAQETIVLGDAMSIITTTLVPLTLEVIALNTGVT